MANGIGFRTNSSPEIKRNVQHVNNRNHEQRNQADVAKYGRTNNRLEERYGDNKPNEGMNTQPVRDNANVFQTFKSYAEAILGNKLVGVSGNNINASNSGEKLVGGVDTLGDVGFSWNLILRIRTKSMIDSLERKDDEGPSLDGGSEHEKPLDVDNCDSDSSKDDNNDSDSYCEMSSTSRLMREVDVRGVDSDHVDSFEEGEIIGESVLNDDGCVKDCMVKKLDDDVEKDIELCSNNVTEKCGVVNNIMSNNVEGEILEDHFDGDRGNDTIEDKADVNPSTNVSLEVNHNTSTLDRSSAKAERLAHHNNGLDDDVFLLDRLLYQDKCRVRPVKAAVNDSSIVSPSTPPGTDLNLAEESCSMWLDYVGPLITDELDSEKRWSYRDLDGNVQGMLVRSLCICGMMQRVFGFGHGRSFFLASCWDLPSDFSSGRYIVLEESNQP
ncbi:hypothetical protein CTI12_AA509060 [Artemisia annua]|uniref:Uncharacterized protein n=1 Tax=Artemisia annua TaxID=35608 RepID=A0A2U1LBN1_ARTAN|nr:hypothetical protein CTI12_AA509060 [Artemisia annua]